MTKPKGHPPRDVFPSFSPSELSLLQGVVNDAWAELRKADPRPITLERKQLTRELLAHRVMARAEQGELDPERLKEHAVRGMTKHRRKHAA